MRAPLIRRIANTARPGLRFIVRLLFRVRLHGIEHFSRPSGPLLIIANHVSWLDGLMLYLFLPVTPCFAVNKDIASRRFVRPLLHLVDHEITELLNPLSLKSLAHRLRSHGSVMIFPEGRMSNTGTQMKVYDGPGMLADKAGASVLPISIDGLQYSRYTTFRGLYRRRWLPRVTIRVLAPQALGLDAGLRGGERRAAAAARITTILREIYFAGALRDGSLFDGLIEASQLHGRNTRILADSTGASLRYKDMLTRAFVLSTVIARLTGRQERVGIMLPSTAAATVSLFACHARGRQAAMLNFTAGVRGLTTAIETADIRVVFTSRAFIEAGGLAAEAAAVAANARLVYLEDLRNEIGVLHKLGGVVAARIPRLAHRWFSRGSSGDDAAVILFTSGSEGIPKGVVLSHANLMANFAQVQMLIDITNRDQVLNVLPIFHAFGLLGGVLLPLFKGTPTYQYPSPLHYRMIPELCYELGVSCLFGTTTFLRGYARNAEPYDFHRMRFVISGAEKMTEETQRLWNDKFGIRIFEGYGATEASPVLAVNNPLANHSGTVGQLLTGMEYYIEPVTGIETGGELVVRGPNVMLGYLFHGSDGEIIQPWTRSHGAGWYETGDIVDVTCDGYIRIIGRAKRFAKIGGEMVSLAAVEDLALLAWPDGEHAALTISDARKGEQIILVTDVREAERAVLVNTAKMHDVAELMIPRKVVHMDALPLLGSGKVDHTSLREQVVRDQAAG